MLRERRHLEEKWGGAASSQPITTNPSGHLIFRKCMRSDEDKNTSQIWLINE